MNAISALPDAPQHVNLEAECALLGALLHESPLTGDIEDDLHSEDFAEPVHGRIYAALCRETRAGRRATPVTLKDEFKQDDGLRTLGGPGYLARLSGDLQGLLAYREIARQIADLAARRRVREQLSQALRACDDLGTSLSAIELPDLVSIDRSCEAIQRRIASRANVSIDRRSSRSSAPDKSRTS